jgi:hypothetical protein
VLQGVQANVKELKAEVQKLTKKMSDGKKMTNKLVAEIGLLERLNQEAAADRLLELEALTTTCKEMAAQVSVRHFKGDVTPPATCAYSIRDGSRAGVKQAY